MGYASEKRGEKRDLFTVTVEFVLSGVSAAETDCLKGYGLTTNKSSSGIGLITNCPADMGQRLVLSGAKLPNQLLTGSVRWCSRISEGIYRIGLRLN